MYRAERDEGSMVGGHTHASLISQNGKFALLNNEMEEAKELAEKVDALLRSVSYAVLRQEPKEKHDVFLRQFRKSYSKLAMQAGKLAMPSLKDLDKQGWSVPPEFAERMKEQAK